jgi:hypothetical protein
LDFWSLFGGDGLFYQLLYEHIAPLDPLKKLQIADNGVIDEGFLHWCSENLKNNIFTGIEAELASQVGNSVRKDHDGKQLNQLVDRKIVEHVPKLDDFLQNAVKPRKSVYVWNDDLLDLNATGISISNLKEFKIRRGRGLESLLGSIVAWHLGNNTLENVTGLTGDRLQIFPLFYQDNSDADLLLIERLSDPDDTRKPKAFIFNIKTHPSSLLGLKGQESRKKFDALSDKFSAVFEVVLCLAVERLAGWTPYPGFDPKDLSVRILNEWSSSKYTVFQKVISLDDFENTAKSLKLSHKFIEDKLIIERPAIQNEILEKLKPGHLSSILLQGRYRVGKTMFLRDMCQREAEWRYCEL